MVSLIPRYSETISWLDTQLRAVCDYATKVPSNIHALLETEARVGLDKTLFPSIGSLFLL